MTSSDWISLAALTLSVLANVIALVARRGDKSDARGAELERRMDRADVRLQKVETELAHAPGVEAIHKLEVSMTEIKGQLAVVTESVRPIKAIADRFQDAIIEGGHK